MKLETEDPEIYGIGEATLKVKTPAIMEAVKLLEMAMYDSAAKLLGIPVYNMLGGQLRDSMPLHVHVDAAMSNFFMQEYVETDISDDLFVDYPIIENGAVVLEDDRPDLGLTLYWDKMESLRSKEPIDWGTTDW